MSSTDRFASAYFELEARMRSLAEADDSVYLPNPRPSRPVEHVFICMEPSLGAWCRSKEEARSKVEHGFRNFLYSMEDFLLHYAAVEYLCRPGEDYHITDVSKGAMLVREAECDRRDRYERWYELLLEELSLVAAPKATLFAVGKPVEVFLSAVGFGTRVTRLLHYSGRAARARNAAIIGNERAFEVFRGNVSHDDVLSVAKDVLERAGLPQPFYSETHNRLTRAKLTDSRRKLLFSYRLAFTALRGRAKDSPLNEKQP
jgi:hypothetical protein